MWVAACDTGIRTVHGLLGHRDVGTTMICPHVLNRGPGGVRSPVDGLAGGGEMRVLGLVRTEAARYAAGARRLTRTVRPPGRQRSCRNDSISAESGEYGARH